MMLCLVILDREHRFHHGDLVIPVRVCEIGAEGIFWVERVAMLVDRVGDSVQGMPIIRKAVDEPSDDSERQGLVLSANS